MLSVHILPYDSIMMKEWMYRQTNNNYEDERKAEKIFIMKDLYNLRIYSCRTWMKSNRGHREQNISMPLLEYLAKRNTRKMVGRSVMRPLVANLQMDTAPRQGK